MKAYNLLSQNDGNDITLLEATEFQEATEEALANIGWYVIDEGDSYVGVNEADPNDTIELAEQIFEDAQYELIERTGYYITSPVTNED
jgi:hypothetical protein